MKRTHLVIFVTLALVSVMSFQSLSAQSSSDTVVAITKLENESVKADLASDTAFAAKVLADDWIGCNSDDKWYTKAEALKMVADTKNNKFNTEKLTDLKVRVYGNAAVATYTDTYDGLVEGQHRVRSILATDVWVKMGSDWRLVSSQGTPTT